MPFKSSAQRAFMYIHHPEIAKEFQAATPKGKVLPRHAKAKAMAKGMREGFNGTRGNS